MRQSLLALAGLLAISAGANAAERNRQTEPIFTIQFGIGHVDIDPSWNRSLDNAAKLAKELHTKLQIATYCIDTEEPDCLALASQRLRAVADALTRDGVARGDIEIVATPGTTGIFQRCVTITVL